MIAWIYSKKFAVFEMKIAFCLTPDKNSSTNCGTDFCKCIKSIDDFLYSGTSIALIRDNIFKIDILTKLS